MIANTEPNSRQKKILILHPHFTITGGAGVFVLEVGSRLADRGYEVIVCAIKCEPKIVDSYKDKIEFIELGGPLSSSLKFWIQLPIFLLKVIRVGKNIKPDLIFPQVFPSNWWGFIYKILLPKTKLLWMCQEPSAFIHSKAWIAAINDPVMGFLLRVLNPILKFIDCSLAKHVDFVFTNSYYGLQYAKDVYHYRPERVRALYLGVNPAFALNDSSPNFKFRKNQIITVSRLTKFKNINVIIDALSELKKLGIAAKLKIVGLGEEEENLKMQASFLGMKDSVIFLGALPLEDLVSELSNSRGFVLASVDEPFGLSIVEAMACGTPAVVVQSGGPSEIVENNVSGFHVAPYSVTDLVSKLSILLQDEAQFNSLSNKAVARSKLFDWELTTDKITKVIEELI